MANPARKRAKWWHVGLAVIAGALGLEWARGRTRVPNPKGKKSSAGSVY